MLLIPGLDYAPAQERPRPEFTAMAPMTLRNPVTGLEEPYFPEKKRMNRTLTGCMAIIIMVGVAGTDVMTRLPLFRLFQVFFLKIHSIHAKV